MRVLHIVPDSITDPRHKFLGSSKDIQGRIEYFQEKDIAQDQVIAKFRSDNLLLGELEQVDLHLYDVVQFELPLYPKSLQLIKTRAPKLPILTRAINAELIHHWHMVRAESRVLLQDGRAKALTKHVRTLWLGWRRFQLDIRFAWSSRFILSISDWETQHYWAHFTPHARLKTLPYYLPDSYSTPPVAPSEKQNWCVCMMSTVQTPFVQDALGNFIRAVERLGTHAPEWRFFVTGDISGMPNLPTRISATGLLDSPFGLLSQARAVALLTDFGVGFKTKILDAVQNGCYVLVTQATLVRLPDEIRPYCIPVDLNDPTLLARGLECARSPFPRGNPNLALKQRAYSALDEIFEQVVNLSKVRKTK